jgi:hypothetical protein
MQLACVQQGSMSELISTGLGCHTVAPVTAASGAASSAGSPVQNGTVTKPW